MLTLNIILLITIPIIILTKCNAKDYCSTDYCGNSKQHTLCRYKSAEPANHCIAYEKTISNENERQMILDKINSRRNKVAAGEIRSLPPAERMPKLEWNSELELAAQRWADQCVKHSIPDIQDTCRDLGNIPVGQNIATIHGDAPGLTPISLVDVWYMELLNINSSILSSYISSSERGNSHYDYFTQLVWDETTHVGCGGVKFKERLEDENVKYRTIYRLVCNFAPTGNLRNRTVYSSGQPCSNCPHDGNCDANHKALCFQNSFESNTETVPSKATIQSNPLLHTTQNIYAGVTDMVTEDNTHSTETIDMTISDFQFELETPLDYYSHLYEYTKQMITPRTKPNSCKDFEVVDNFVELLKKKLSNDPMIKDLLLTNKSAANSYSESIFTDDGVAAFVDKVYSKKESSTTRKTIANENFNSTFLVDLIEAVIFRSGDKIPVSQGYSQNTRTMSTIKPVMVQAELAEVKQNEDFTGHYFFPEEDEETSTETTELYYDDVNLPVSDLVLEDLKMRTVTKDFLDDILESDTSVEKFDNILINMNSIQTKGDYFQKLLKRNRRNLNVSRSDFYNKNNKCTYQLISDHKKNILKSDLCNSNSKKMTISYKGLLQKLAADLKKLRLNERFHCTHNDSTALVYRHIFLFVTTMLFF